MKKKEGCKKKKNAEERTKRETRPQEQGLRRLEMEAEIMRQKEAPEAAKREHELELAGLGQGNLDVRPRDKED